MSGLEFASQGPERVERAIEITRDVLHKEVDPEMYEELEKANDTARFTKNEIDRGFPLLHAFTIVAFWSTLESAIEDMLVGIMCHEPSVLEAPAFSKVRIPFAKYEQLDKEERMRLLLSEIQRTDSSGLMQGVKTFENLLNIFGFGGPVDPSIAETLWQLNNLRNIIVHRNSRADRRFVENCPSLNFKVGDHILIDHTIYMSVTRAVFDYLMVVLERVHAHYKTKIPNVADDAQAEVL